MRKIDRAEAIHFRRKIEPELDVAIVVDPPGDFLAFRQTVKTVQHAPFSEFLANQPPISVAPCNDQEPKLLKMP